MSQITMKQLLEAGVHFGHQTRRWNPKMKPYIFGARNGIYIIDLQKTVRYFRTAYSFIADVAQKGEKVLFVGTKKQAQDSIVEEAVRADQFYVNNRWLGGTLTNFRTIQGRLRRLADLETATARGDYIYLTKKEQLDIANEIERMNRFFGGIKGMTRLPAAVFIIDTVKESIAVAECERLRTAQEQGDHDAAHRDHVHELGQEEQGEPDRRILGVEAAD